MNEGFGDDELGKLKSDHKQKKEKINLLAPMTTAVSGPKIELYSNKEAAIDGCKGVIDYRDDLIKFRVTGGAVTINGEKIELLELTDNSALIKGEFQSVEFLMR